MKATEITTPPVPVDPVVEVKLTMSLEEARTLYWICGASSVDACSGYLKEALRDTNCEGWLKPTEIKMQDLFGEIYHAIQDAVTR